MKLSKAEKRLVKDFRELVAENKQADTIRSPDNPDTGPALTPAISVGTRISVAGEMGTVVAVSDGNRTLMFERDGPDGWGRVPMSELPPKTPLFFGAIGPLPDVEDFLKPKEAADYADQYRLAHQGQEPDSADGSVIVPPEPDPANYGAGKFNGRTSPEAVLPREGVDYR